MASVESAKWLINKHKVWLHTDHASQYHELLKSTRQLADWSTEECVQPKPRENGLRCIIRRRRLPVHIHESVHMLEHRQIRIESARLRHIAFSKLIHEPIRIIYSPRSRTRETRNETEERRLPTSVSPGNADPVTFSDSELVNPQDFTPSIPLGHRTKGQQHVTFTVRIGSVQVIHWYFHRATRSQELCDTLRNQATALRPPLILLQWGACYLPQ